VVPSAKEIARLNLNERNFGEFKRLIELAYTLDDHPTFGFLFWYHLRNFPVLLFAISSVINFLSWLKNAWIRLFKRLKRIVKKLLSTVSAK
jgi:hypothetical protein